MGDRANVKIIEDGTELFLYSHWSGTELPEITRGAMARGRGRWTDPSYLTRIIFSSMIVNEVNGETGYGISTQLGDGDDRILVVDHDTKTVYRDGHQDKAVTFEVFAESGPVEWSTLGGD